MDTGESSENAKQEDETENCKDVSGNDEETKGPPERPVFKMNMDKIMEQIELPFRKIKFNLYLVAMSTREEIEKVVMKIQTLTKVTWSVKQTREFDHLTKKPLTLFKRTYGCHMATRCRTNTKKIRNKKSRNINCPAQLLVTVRKYNSRTRSKLRGPLLDAKYPCALEFRNHHNHRTDAVDVLNTRPLGDEIKLDVLKLLNKGHSCASAYHTLYTIKVEEFGTDYKKKMSDRHNFPKKNDISTLWKLHNFKEKTELNTDFAYTIKNLEEILNSYQQKNGTLYKMIVVDQVIVVCICTPLMQRTIQQVSEILFIDSSGEDIKEYKMYFILTQASVGALPIGCILTNSHCMTAFNDGMRLFFQMIHIQPTVVLTNTEIMKELIGQKFFLNSRIMYSFYHILNASWKVLHETRHEIVRAKKEAYYQLFREVIFADCEEGLVVARQVLAVECAQQRFLGFVDKMYEHITLWCLFYRQYIVLRGIETFNYNEAETSFRLFRLLSKIPLERTKLLNLTQITDYMCSAFEKYYKNRIMELVLGKESKVLQEKYERTVDHVLQMEDIGHHQYLFKKTFQEMLDDYYQVDMITSLCSCALGVMGKHCEHISEVLKRGNILSPPLTIEQKAAYYFVAAGVLKRKNSFLPNQDDDLGKEYRIICCSPETILGPEYEGPSADLQPTKNTSPPIPNFETAKNKWLSYCNKIVRLMEQDPAKFLPAVTAHMENIQKYSTSVPMLLKGLYAGFPYKGDVEKLPPLTIISNKVITPAKTSHPAPLAPKPSTSDGPPSLVSMKRGIGEPSGAKKTRSKVARRPAARRNSKKPPKPSVEIADSPWNNFSSESSSPLVMDNNEHYSDEDVKQNITILDEKDGVLLEKHSEVDKEISRTDLKLSAITFTDTLAFNDDSDLLNDKNNFVVESAQFEDMTRDEAAIYDVQKGIYVDEAALSQLAECDIAVLDEKKGILIIPMPPE